MLRDIFNFRRKSMLDVTNTQAAAMGSEEWSTGSDVDRRVIPSLIDHLASTRPDAIYAHIPRTSNIDHAFRQITYSRYACAINRAADWLEDCIGRGQSGTRIAYIGPSNLKYVILISAAAKLGCQMVYLSPRNSLEGQLHVLDAVDCHVFATPLDLFPGTAAILEARPFKHIVTPSLDAWLDGPEPTARLHTRPFEEIRHEPLWLVHSSGTTSLPKPVGWNHGCNAAMLYDLEHNFNGGETTLRAISIAGRRMLVGFPLFFAGGMFWPLLFAPWAGVEVILPPDDQPFSSGLADKIHSSSLAPMTSLLPPVILEEFVKHPRYMTNLANLPMIVTGGAPLPKSVGDAIQAFGPCIANVLASSECGMLPTFRAAREDWQDFHFVPDAGLQMREIGNNNHELVILNREDPSRPQGAFENFPALKEWTTSDLFVKHPDPVKSHLWCAIGRADDVVALINGSKFNPIALEMRVQAHAEVNCALVFGRDRPNAALLIEPKDPAVRASPDTTADFLERLWPTVRQACRSVPKYGRILESHIFITTPEKPMHTTAKGNVMRNATYKDYDEEVARLYDSAADVVPSESDTPVSIDNVDVTSPQGVHRRICNIAGIDDDALSYDDNVFLAGFDSLHVMQLTRFINNALGVRRIAPSMVYANPTAEKLAHAIASDVANVPTDTAVRNRKITQTLDLLSQNLPSRRAPPPKIAILTGSSGSLGQHLLHDLLPRFAHIYCLIRSPRPGSSSTDSRVTFLHSNLADPLLGLDFEQYTALVNTTTHVLHNAWLVNFNQPVDFFQPLLDGVRNLIDFAARATHKPRVFFVSTGAAAMERSLSSSSLIPDVDSPDRSVTPQPSETSSDSSIVHVEHNTDMNTLSLPPSPRRIPSTLLPEVISSDTDVDQVCASPPQVTGYAQSKWIAERLLLRAGHESGVSATIARLGQIAGPSTMLAAQHGLPSWAPREWFPSLMASSKHLRCVPRTLGSGVARRLDWIPVDLMASTVVELFDPDREAHGQEINSEHRTEKTCEERETTDMYHLFNPSTQPPDWERDLLPVVLEHLDRATKRDLAPAPTTAMTPPPSPDSADPRPPSVQVVDLPAWVRILSESGPGAANPALNLLPFFELMASADGGAYNAVRLDTSRAVRDSRTLREMRPVNAEWMAIWLGQWFGEGGE